jgi:hypothetical protein
MYAYLRVNLEIMIEYVIKLLRCLTGLTGGFWFNLNTEYDETQYTNPNIYYRYYLFYSVFNFLFIKEKVFFNYGSLLTGTNAAEIYATQEKFISGTNNGTFSFNL